MVIVFAIALVSFAYFCQGGGPNANSRFDLTRAIVRDHTVSIDAYAKNTSDKAEREGHFYSDKAPGLSFAAVPAYAAFHALRSRAPATAKDDPRSAMYFLTVAIVATTSAAGAVALFAILRRTRVGPKAALVAVAAWCFGTNAFAYATIFVAHQFVAALVVTAWALLLHARREGAARAVALAGFLAAWAAISEYPVAIVSAMLFAYGIVRIGARKMIPFVVAAALPLALLAVYNRACFGSPFALGYEHLANPVFHAIIDRGFFGLSLPTAQAARELTVGEFRGLLPLSPFVLLAPVGYARMIRDRDLRAEGVLCLGAAAFLALLNASYLRWDGGAAMGPRYFVPALPFVIVPVAHALSAIGAIARRTLRAAAVAGTACAIVFAVAVCTMSVAVMPEFPEAPLPTPIPDRRAPDPPRPITTLVLPLFFAGHVGEKASFSNGTIGFSSIVTGHEHDAYNFGETLGLHGAATLLPLMLAWLIGAIALARVRDRSKRPSTSPLGGDR